MPNNEQQPPKRRRQPESVSSHRRTEHKQVAKREEMHQVQAKKKRLRGCFFWLLLFFVGSLIFAGHYGYQKYQSAKKAANSIYHASKAQKVRDVESTLKEGKPIAILLLGTDTGALGRTFKGRTDTIIVAVLNPTKKKMTIVSLPRDAEVAVSGYEKYFPSKLNSAYEYGGSTTAVETVQKYLNIPIDFYATINMGGLETLIDAVGGVDVEPLLTFTYDNQSFTKGKKTHMNGKRALAYVRMRYDDPNGDYGRQARQRQVLTQVALKGASVSNLLNQKFLSTISKQMVTDLSFNDLLLLGTKYRVATHDMKTDSLQGQSQMINGSSFEVPTTEEKQRITDLLRSALGLKSAETGNTLSSSTEIDAEESE